MKLRDIGESALIDILSRFFEGDESVIVGIGDDAAILENRENMLPVLSIDTMVEGIHIPREMEPEDIGWTLLQTSASDLASMGALPHSCVISMTLRPDLELEFVERIAIGAREAAEDLSMRIVGGDISEGRQIVLSCSVFGWVERDRYLTRSGARPGDIVCSTGYLGEAAAGTKIIVGGISEDIVGGGLRRRFLSRALRPRARIREGRILREMATACIDSSDGLARSLREISKMSGVGFRIYEDKLPISSELIEFCSRTGEDPVRLALYGDGDYELIFTIPEDLLEDVERELRKAGSMLFQIGDVIEDDDLLLIRKDGRIERLRNGGYEHFRGSAV